MTNRALIIYMDESREPGACELYRGNIPLSFLQKHGDWITGWLWFGEIAQRQIQSNGEYLTELVRDNDIFIFPRVSAKDDEGEMALATLFAAIRANGKRIIFEVDDDYTNEHRQVIEGDAMKVAKMTDAITVSTQYLGELMQKRTKRPYHVLPNSIDPYLWRDLPFLQSPTLEDRLVIGLTGSITHYEDWQVLQEVLPRIIFENPEVTLLIMGFHPGYLHGLQNTMYLPGANYIEYAQVIRNIDIALAPVNPLDVFNLSKSPIKAIEAQAAHRPLEDGTSAGAAIITTHNPVYELAVKNEKTGLLVEHTPEAWYTAITRLIEDEQLRRAIQIEGHKRVYEKYDINQTWKLWDKAYKKVLKSAPNAMKLKVLPLPS